MVSDSTSILSREYNTALDSFVEQLQRDPNILAAFVYGSMVRGDLWSESDIDMLVISKDDSLPYQQHWIKDGDILIQLDVQSRRNFRLWMDVPLHGTVLHHIIATGRMLFSHDDTISEYHRTASQIGERDKNLGMMIYANCSIGYLEKVRKNIVHKKAPLAAFWWLTQAIEELARLEVLSNGDVPEREVVLQAREYNNELFGRGFTEIIENGVNLEALKESYELSRRYVEEKAATLFDPILSYILEQGGHCGISVIDKHFRRKLKRNEEFTLISACELLADLGFLQRMVCPVKLTSKSRHEVYEAGYLSMRGDLV